MNQRTYSLFFPDRSVALHALPVNVGWDEVKDHGYYWDGIRRGNGEMQIWQYTLSGQGALRVGDQEWNLKPQDALFVEVPGDHAYYLPRTSERWEFLFFSFFGTEATRLAREIRTEFGPKFSLARNGESVDVVRSFLHRCEAGTMSSRFEASAWCYRFVTTLFDELERARAVGSPGNRLLSQVYDYVRSHLSEEFDVRELAAACGVSRSHFTRRFHAIQKMAPRDFILETRLSFARLLLQTEKIPVKEVAARVGFRDPSYFCRVFRKRYNMSPDEYRHNMQPAES